MTAGRILVGSFGPPQFDRDSGSRRVMDLLELLVEQRWHVTFVSANGLRKPRYAQALRRRGIHVVDGETQSVGDLVITGRFDIALLVSWPVGELYLPLLRKFSPETRVVVDSLDLQFLRDSRRVFQGVSGTGVLDDEFGRQLVAELNTYVAADAVLTVSEKEAALLEDVSGGAATGCVIPDIENVPDSEVDVHDRTGMLFVGSFRHMPNVGAVEYLCREIVPRLGPQLLADHPISIVGDGLDEAIRRYAHGLPGVRMIGWVPDVLPYLQRARVSLVPLQFGAGTKRKMIQTLIAGTPCVSTSIGIEGLDLRDGTHLLVADGPEAFAAAIERLLDDDNLWQRLAQDGRRAVEAIHGRAAVADRFAAVLTEVLERRAKGPLLREVPHAIYESRLMYQDNQRCAAGLRGLLSDAVPADAIVLVASGGSEELLRLGDFTSWHFPRADDGSPAPNPGNAPALVATVGHLQVLGATHLLFPKRARWWLDLYPPFEEHLRARHTVVSDDHETGVLFALTGVERRSSGSRRDGRAPVGTARRSQSEAGGGTEPAKLIAFYLPQYHPIPENDEWWGRGFTEWTNVTRATPLFPGHHQPHVPSELGFYDLRVAETRRAQAGLARAHGIHAFCYYHYWFAGKQLLERPFADVLASGEPDFPFCLCWANEPWSRRWDGRADDVLQAQTYSPADDVAHLRALLPAFADRRYLTIEGKPLFIVYQARDLPDPGGTVARWRAEAGRAGLPGLYLMTVETGWDAGWDATEVGFDAKVLFQPQFSLLAKTPRLHVGDLDSLQVYDYERSWPRLAEPPPVSYLRYETVFPSWDNSPRRGSDAVVVHNSSPEAYGAWLHTAVERAVVRPAPEPLVFINAWNEWGEGAHLEPDVGHGRAYLEATRRALDAVRASPPRAGSALPLAAGVHRP
jgi:glycosyltransferase involved in cell wall biosynthesis